MPITIAKDAGAGAGSDTTLEIRNFGNLAIKNTTPVDTIGDLTNDAEDAVLIKSLGPMTMISFEYSIVQETSSVVTAGIGGSVTTPAGQIQYLMDTLLSQGSSQIIDTYTLTLDFGGGVTIVRTGVITQIDCTMTSQEPITFTGHIDFQVGTVA